MEHRHAIAADLSFAPISTHQGERTTTMEHGNVRAGPPVGVGIGNLSVTPNRNGEIGVLCVESDLAGVGQHNKT